MKRIPLTRDKHALVDDKDYAELSKHKWQAMKVRGIWYASRTYRHPTLKNSKGGKKHIAILMHRAILDAPENKWVDHRDGNGLNNQRYNLRVCEPSENLWNQRKRTGDYTSQYKGVSRIGNKWAVNIYANGIKHHLGRYTSEKAAAREYDKLAKLLHGEYAKLNFS